MYEQEIEIYEKYFGERPSITIDIDDAEIYKELLEQKILNKKYNGILKLEQDLNKFKDIEKKINEIKNIIEEIITEN